MVEFKRRHFKRVMAMLLRHFFANSWSLGNKLQRLMHAIALYHPEGVVWRKEPSKGDFSKLNKINEMTCFDLGSDVKRLDTHQGRSLM